MRTDRRGRRSKGSGRRLSRLAMHARKATSPPRQSTFVAPHSSQQRLLQESRYCLGWTTRFLYSVGKPAEAREEGRRSVVSGPLLRSWSGRFWPPSTALGPRGVRAFVWARTWPLLEGDPAAGAPVDKRAHHRSGAPPLRRTTIAQREQDTPSDGGCHSRNELSLSATVPAESPPFQTYIVQSQELTFPGSSRDT